MFVLRCATAFMLISSVFSDFDCYPCECKNEDCDMIEADCSARTTEIQIREIPKYLPSSIGHLDLTGQQLKVLKENVFENANLTGLRKLTLQNCQISEINKNAFANLGNLTYLDASYNNVSLIDNATFSSMKNLKTLDLRNNLIQNVTFSQNLTELETLLLNYNNITYLDENLFVNNSKLESLELSNNNMEILPDKLFNNLTNLKYLHISYNRLSRIPNNTFQNNSRLLSLVLENNEIAELPKTLFNNVASLNVLDLGHNKIEEIPENFFQNLINLEFIQLTNNELEIITNSTFKNISSLHTLDLSYNKITSINTEFVEYSSCLHNSNFVTLHLSHNNISSLPAGVFRKSCRWESIDLSYNKISKIDVNAFSGAYLNLNLSHNEISFLSNNTFKNITNLDLSFNNLSVLPDGIFNSIKSTLNLENNNFKNTSWKWFGSSRCFEVLLANNNITYFEMNATNFFYLDLLNNSINCDCKLRKQHELFTPQMVNIQCSSPLSLKGKNWNILNSNQFACEPEIRDNSTETINGSTKQIGCKVYASPAQNIQWLKNNKTIQDTTILLTRTNVSEDVFWYNLTFLKNATDFTGQYTFVLRNFAGAVDMNFTVLQQVQPSPKPKEESIATAIWITVVVLVFVIVLVALVRVFRKRRQRNTYRNNSETNLLYDPLVSDAR